MLLFVLGFGSSSALSAAYGASVVGTMLLTTCLGAVVARLHWNWPLWLVALVFGGFLLVDLAFVAGNATKIPHGGWVPLSIAAAMYLLFKTWRDGRISLRAELNRRAVRLERLPDLLCQATRVPGTGVFLVSNPEFIPTALLRNLEHNHVCHERVVMLNLEIVRTPRYTGPRAWVETLQPNVYAVRARFGFMETPDVHRGPAQRPPAWPEGHRRRRLVLPRLAPGPGAPAPPLPAGPEVPAVRLHAAAQRAGGGILPHAHPGRDGAGDRHRTLGRPGPRGSQRELHRHDDQHAAGDIVAAIGLEQRAAHRIAGRPIQQFKAAGARYRRLLRPPFDIHQCAHMHQTLRPGAFRAASGYTGLGIWR